jgi:hypothetical protein
MDTKNIFFEQLLFDAAKKTGDTSGIINDIKAISKPMGIEVDTERIEQFNNRLVRQLINCTVFQN